MGPLYLVFEIGELVIIIIIIECVSYVWVAHNDTR